MIGTLLVFSTISDLIGRITNSLIGLLGQMIGSRFTKSPWGGNSFSEQLKEMEEQFNREYNAYRNSTPCCGSRCSSLPSTGCGSSSSNSVACSVSPRSTVGCGASPSQYNPYWSVCNNRGVRQICCTLYPR